MRLNLTIQWVVAYLVSGALFPFHTAQYQKDSFLDAHIRGGGARKYHLCIIKNFNLKLFHRYHFINSQQPAEMYRQKIELWCELDRVNDYLYKFGLFCTVEI